MKLTPSIFNNLVDLSTRGVPENLRMGMRWKCNVNHTSSDWCRECAERKIKKCALHAEPAWYLYEVDGLDDGMTGKVRIIRSPIEVEEFVPPTIADKIGRCLERLRKLVLWRGL